MILLDWLSAKYPTAKKTTLKRMVEAGRVRVNGQCATRLKQALGEKDKVEVTDQAPAIHRPGRLVELPFEIIHEDEDILVVHKPAGLLTSTVPREPRPTLLAAIREYVKEKEPAARIGLIHRLDRDAAGLLIFSKNDEAYQSLKSQFFKHTVARVYTAIVRGVPTPRAGRIESKLIERADGTIYSTTVRDKGDVAVTHYETMSSAGGRSVLKVTLHTGRKHQIRVHLAERAVPIIGDRVYGTAAEKNGDAPLLLAAVRLEIEHPHSGKRMSFMIPEPDYFHLEPVAE